MDYIRKLHDLSLYVCKDQQVTIVDKTFQKFMNTILNRTLSDLYSREKTTKRQLGYKSKIPIYVNEAIFLMCIRSYRLDDSFYINYFAIRNYRIFGDHVIIDFANRHSMKIHEKHAFLHQLEKCREVLEFLNDRKMLT